jgi:hypothetical protein
MMGMMDYRFKKMQKMFGGLKNICSFVASKYQARVVTPDIKGFFYAHQDSSVVTLRIVCNEPSRPSFGALTAGSAALLFYYCTSQKPNVMLHSATAGEACTKIIADIIGSDHPLTHRENLRKMLDAHILDNENPDEKYEVYFTYSVLSQALEAIDKIERRQV